MEFAGMAEAYARRHGHGGMLRDRDFQGGAYPWHILSGESGAKIGPLDAPASGEGTSAAFPSGAGHRRLHSGEPIMIDFGTVLNGYHCDETRMFAIGSLPAAARKACDAVIHIYQRVLEKVRPGVCGSNLFDHAVAVSESIGYGEAFLGPPGNKVSFIGHGIGTELIEPPFIARNRKALLVPGMTFALEPKMVFENRYGVGIESVIQVTETGHRPLTRQPLDPVIC